MLQRKTIIWTILALAFLGGIVYFSILRKPKVEYVTEEAKRGDLKETVSVTRTLKANDTISLDFETTGRVKSVDVRVGQKVARGDVIGMIDDANLQNSVEQAKANLEKARADAGVSGDSISIAQVAKENAEDFLDDTKRLNKANVEAAEQAVNDAEDKLDDAENYYSAVKSESGSDSSTTKSAKLTLDTAPASLNAAQKALDVADQQADLSKTSAENSLNTAEANLDAAKSVFVRAGTDAVVAGFEAAYQTALTNADKAVLRAPANGIIKEVNYKIGEVIGATGTDNFAKMISYDFIMEAKVPESAIPKMKT